MISRERVLQIFEEAGVLQTGHFILTSGRHSDKYLQCARIFQNTKYSEELCRALAQKFEGQKIDVVIGPAMGAVQMAYEVSRALGCENYFTERENGKMTLRRGFKTHEGQRVLLVEDVLTTGGTLFEVMEMLKEKGAVVVGVGSIVDRTNGKVDFGVPFESVIKISVESYEPSECPLCMEAKTPPVKPGSRSL